MRFDRTAQDVARCQKHQGIDDVNEVIERDPPRNVGLAVAMLFQEDKVRISLLQSGVIGGQARRCGPAVMVARIAAASVRAVIVQ